MSHTPGIDCVQTRIALDTIRMHKSTASRLRRDRDRLLAALEMVSQYLDDADDDALIAAGIGSPFRARINAAIAKAKGEA